MYSIPVMSSIQINVYNKYTHHETETAFENIFKFAFVLNQ